MGNCRVTYKPDGQVSITIPLLKAKKKGESEQAFLDRAYAKAVIENKFEGFDFDDMDTTDLPDYKKREKWRGNKATGVYIDESIITPAERRQVLVDDLNTEFGKPQSSRNSAKILDLQRRLATGDY